MVAFDASIGLIMWFPDVPCDVENAADRVDFLIEDLERRNEKILIPTPALAEMLVEAGSAGPEFVNKITRSSRFQIGSFDTKAAIEVALAIATARKAGNKRGKGNKDNWQKVKFDHQIVAISKAEGVTTLYSSDPGLAKFAKANGLEVIALVDLPCPPSKHPLFEGVPELEEGNKAEEKKPLMLAAPARVDTTG